MKSVTMIAGSIIALLLTGCSAYHKLTEPHTYTSLANPAAVYCVKQKGKLETVTENGGRVTYCHLNNNKRIEQWDFYRQSHQSAKPSQ